MADISSSLIEEFENASLKLDLSTLLDVIAGNALSERASAAIVSSAMCDSAEEMKESQSEIREVMSLFDNGEDIPLQGWRDSSKVLSRMTAAGSVISGEELLLVAKAEKKALEVQRSMASKEDGLLSVSRHLGGFTDSGSVVKNILRCIDTTGEVEDSASSELRSIRKRSSGLRNRMRKEFADFASSSRTGDGNEFVSVRGDRYVVSVPRSDSAAIKGLIHHTSGSGASLFIEPYEFIEKNNRLESLLREERRELERILAGLTLEVFELREELSSNQDILVRLDTIRAKSLFSRDYRCTMPLRSTDGTMNLRNARHPLLERMLRASKVQGEIVGLDIECKPELSVLVISGPNAGGKTVALKTIGMVVLMDRLGLPVPCGDESILPFHRDIFVDIGDDQSIERSLSTYSSRIERMTSILDLVRHDSLVLIDEIGDGTDPQEGAAIGCALLEELIRVSGRSIVTTHMSVLKGWAYDTKGAENATLKFDSERVLPLYQLQMGIPGRSWGIEMARRLGLQERIVETAIKKAGEDTIRLEELLGHLEKTGILLDREREELATQEKELSGLISEYKEKVGVFDKKREEMEESARRDALDLINKTRGEMEHLVREIRTRQADREVIRKARTELKQTSEMHEKILKKKEIPSVIDPELLRPGSSVMINSLKKHGKIISIEGGGRIKIELPGGMRVETRDSDLSEWSGDSRKKKQERITWMIGNADPVSPELMVRGMERIEALEEVDAYLDKAVLQGLTTVRIIHGIGKGILKKAIYDMLRRDPRVAEAHPGEPAIGGDGVAVVKLK
ncbi:MAG: Smr/MutS family protein [Candidatus Krumholzibacteria bacterium]|nr:Smr/MutS family protein [Candidatus Krumholzibacteria bacterium]